MSQNVRLTIQVEFFFSDKKAKGRRNGNVRISRRSLFGFSPDVPTCAQKLRVRVIQRPPSNTNLYNNRMLRNK